MNDGSRLKEEIDLDMVTRDLTEGYKTTWQGEGNRVTKKTKADTKKVMEAKAKSKSPLNSFKSKQPLPELQQLVISLQVHLLQLRTEFAAYKVSSITSYICVSPTCTANCKAVLMASYSTSKVVAPECYN
ncbi:hypothetical protein M9H77_31364 [Catharanthus roseus]|uniref:Uncharacterized protein n=1 Tax=Catharanthus roseus TaxID=4058 RepID=A0ACB9ZZX0_CATRO|nr:hypothetical protein M9H77_31364 [Catharanthus roseus]